MDIYFRKKEELIMISDHLAGHIKKTAIAQIAHHADVLRGSSRVPGVGTLDEPLRTSAWEATRHKN